MAIKLHHKGFKIHSMKMNGEQKYTFFHKGMCVPYSTIAEAQAAIDNLIKQNIGVSVDSQNTDIVRKANNVLTVNFGKPVTPQYDQWYVKRLAK